LGIGIGGLEQVENIADGATASVYRAYDRSGRRWVAVKVLARSDDEFRRRFSREMAKLRQLADLPGVAEVFATGETDRGRPYVMMRHFAGGSLQDRLNRDGGLAAAAASEIMVGVAETVHQAHRLGIVHRDIKPANILLDDSGRAQVTDFGIARLFDESVPDGPDVLTLAPAYAAPELLTGGAAGVAADVYALGATTYSAFSGLVPYADGVADAAQLMARVQNSAVPELDHAVPAHVRQAVDFAMAKAPTQRPHSAAAFAAMLRSGAGGLANGGRADLRLVGSETSRPTSFVTEHVAMVQPNRQPRLAPSPPQGSRSPARRPRAAVLVSLLGVVGVLALAGFLLTRGSDGSSTAAGSTASSLVASSVDSSGSDVTVPSPSVGGAVQVPVSDPESTTAASPTTSAAPTTAVPTTEAPGPTFDLEFLEDLDRLENLVVPDADTTLPDADTTLPDADTTLPDTSVPDTTVPDTSVPDTSVPDTSTPDTSVPGTSVTDSSVSDTSLLDSAPAISGVFSLGLAPDGLTETVVVSWEYPASAAGFFVERQSSMGSFTWPEDGTLLSPDARTVTLAGEFDTGSVAYTITVVALVDGNQVRSEVASFVTQPTP
jgi:serine/threonine protein kinase